MHGYFNIAVVSVVYSKDNVAVFQVFIKMILHLAKLTGLTLCRYIDMAGNNEKKSKILKVLMNVQTKQSVYS